MKLVSPVASHLWSDKTEVEIKSKIEITQKPFMSFPFKKNNKKKAVTKLHSFPLWMKNRFPRADAHNNQVVSKKEQGLRKLLRTLECNTRYAIPPLEGTETTPCAGAERAGWMALSGDLV